MIFKKLDARGLAHYVLPLAIIVLVGSIGTYMLVASHADSCPGGIGSSSSKLTGGSCTFHPVTSTAKGGGHPATIEYSSSKATSKPKAAPQPTSGSQGADSDAAAPVSLPASSSAGGGDDPAPVASTASYPTVKHVDPRGDIVVVSYEKDPAHPNADRQRKGGVAVTIKRDGGGADCLTHSNGKGSTSQQQYLKKKDGTKVLTHGTIHFLNCKTGKYTVSTTGRSGYTVLTKMPKTFTLNANENHRVNIVIQSKTASAAASGGTSAGSTTTSTGTGGTSADVR